MNKRVKVPLSAATAALLITHSSLLLSQPVNTPAEAFKAGQDFAKGTKGSSSAAAALNSNTAGGNVPKFNANPPEKELFGGGKNMLGGEGSGKVADCKNHVAGNAYDQQECNAVNFLNKTERTNNFTINRNTDPLLINSRETVRNPGTIPATGTSACHIETVNAPGTFTTERCEESPVLSSLLCKKTFLPECSYEGAPISEHSTRNVGAFRRPIFVEAGTAGLYNYSFDAYGQGNDGSADLNFKLDTVGMGGFVTIRLSNLDDAAAIAVNDTTVFAGYPNAGPHYSSGFFPTAVRHFQLGYSWSEDVGGHQCAEFDLNGYCVRTVYVPDVRTFVANTKLLDYCPGGYAPSSQKQFQKCDPETQPPRCQPLSSDTANNIPGFFCNSEGKFLMNRHEGRNTWAGDVTATMPLRPGNNTIRVYWGTEGRGAGNASVNGQIYNVAPACRANWDDQCDAPRSASQRN